MTLAAAVVALHFASAAPLEAQRGILIERFDAEIEVATDASIIVTERIQVRFVGSWNGIVRRIPVEYRTPQGLRRHLELDDVSIETPQGSALNHRREREVGYRSYRVEVPGAEDATRTVVIRYRARFALEHGETHDELYWNVTGTEWDMPIVAASAQVRLPQGVEGVRTAAWTGGYGSRGNASRIAQRGDTVRFETGERLGMREGLTIAVAWNAGVVARPSLGARAARTLRANWWLGIPLIPAAVMAVLWSLTGRDPRRGTTVVRYEPPEGMTPAEAGAIIDNRVDPRDVAATLVDLARRGFLRLESRRGPDEEPDLELVPLTPRTEWKSLEQHEDSLLRIVFGSGKSMPTARWASDLGGAFSEAGWEFRRAVFGRLMRAGHFRSQPGDVTGWYWSLGWHVLLYGGGLGFLAWYFALIPPLPAAITVLASAAPIFLFAPIMSTRTPHGARARDAVLGLEAFLSRVEADPLERMERTPDLFYRLLPYAIALGVERRWAESFRGLTISGPSWYVSPQSDWTPEALQRDLDRVASHDFRLGPTPSSRGGPRVAGAFATRRRWGGGGGGFSGGGRGGGGGSGW